MIRSNVTRLMSTPQVYRRFFATAGQMRNRVLLEVERKFLPTPVSVAYLRSGGNLAFKKYKSLGRKTIKDAYFDRGGLLFAKGIYIRRRNEEWEAKIRTDGNFINSAFLEVHGSKAVQDIIRKHLKAPVNGQRIEDLLSPCAEFVTERESWMLGGKFQVDVDVMDFGHIVGEVELTKYFLSDPNRSASELKAAKETTCRSMDADIDNFMKSHPQAFSTGRPLGKLSAYFQMFPKV